MSEASPESEKKLGIPLKIRFFCERSEPRMPKKVWNIQEYSRKFKKIQEYSRIFKINQKYSRILKNTQECSRIF